MGFSRLPNLYLALEQAMDDATALSVGGVLPGEQAETWRTHAARWRPREIARLREWADVGAISVGSLNWIVDCISGASGVEMESGPYRVKLFALLDRCAVRVARKRAVRIVPVGPRDPRA